MKPLCLFLGFLFGLALGGASDWVRICFFLLFSLATLLLAWRGKSFPYAASSLGAGLLIGMLGRIPPASFSPRFGVVIRASDNYYILQSFFSRFYVSGKGHGYEAGDVLSIQGRLSPLRFATYESRFDFASYLVTLGVERELIPSEGGVREIFANPIRIRAYSSYCLRGFDPSSRSLISGVLFNRKDSGDDLYQRLSSLNLLYLFSSSGIVASFFLRKAERLFWYKSSEAQAKAATLVLSLLLCLLSPYKIGLWRIFLTRLYTLLNINHGKLFKGFELTSFAGLTLLLLDFHLAYQNAFWIGFGASLFSYFSNGFFLLDRKEDQIIPKFVLFQVFFLPVLLRAGGGKIHLLSPFFSFLFLPFALCYLFLGVFALLGCPFHAAAAAATKGCSAVVSFFERYDASLTLFPSGDFFLFLYYALVAVGVYLVQLGDRPLFRKIGLVCLGLYLLSYAPICPALSEEVSFINVGQGDAILIRDGLTSVMIDTGGNLSFDMAKESLIPFLRKKRIYTLDYLIASHGDYDHIGAKDSLMANFPVKNFIDEASSFPLKAGNLTFRNLNTYPGDDENESSLVLSLRFMDEDYLFTGDAPVEIEKKIIKDNPSLRCGILKVGHHGSDTSTCEEFLDQLKPKEAVISAGWKNRYGHPKQEVLERLRKRAIKIRRTDLEGTITYARAKRWKV